MTTPDFEALAREALVGCEGMRCPHCGSAEFGSWDEDRVQCHGDCGKNDTYEAWHAAWVCDQEEMVPNIAAALAAQYLAGLRRAAEIIAECRTDDLLAGIGAFTNEGVRMLFQAAEDRVRAEAASVAGTA